MKIEILSSVLFMAAGVPLAQACELRATDQVASCVRTYLTEWATGISAKPTIDSEFADFAGRTVNPSWVVPASAPASAAARRHGQNEAQKQAKLSANQVVYK
jgi:hypothetical protein